MAQFGYVLTAMHFGMTATDLWIGGIIEAAPKYLNSIRYTIRYAVLARLGTARQGLVLCHLSHGSNLRGAFCMLLQNFVKARRGEAWPGAARYGTVRQGPKNIWRMYMAEKDISEISIPDVESQKMDIWVIGDTPLLCHKFSESMIQEILDKQTGDKPTKIGRKPKDPEQEYIDSMYYLPNGEYGFPAANFKQSVVGACRNVDGLSMVRAKTLFFVLGDILKLYGNPRMRRDVVRLNGKSADIRFRGEFPKWAIKLSIKMAVGGLSPTQMAGLLQLAGQTQGVGDWRPEKGGSMGMYHVGSEEEVSALGFEI